MRVLFVVPRYGEGFSGGAEGATRSLARQLASRSHEVAVVTSRAVSYADWKDRLASGTSQDDGVTVHRLSVERVRDRVRFDALNTRVTSGFGVVAPELEDAWMAAQGPVLGDLVPWLGANAAGFDVAVFVTYLYWTTWAGLAPASALLPTVLHPLAHNEPHLQLPIFRWVLRAADALGFVTPEEEHLVRTRLGLTAPGAVTGLGVGAAPSADPARFRSAWRLGDEPYLLYVGRLDPSKATDELALQFAAYKDRRPGPLRLVLVGDPVHPVAPHPDIVVTGFVDEQTKHDALAGARAFVVPSYYESFSIVLAEAWSHGTPALVQRECDVLAGQCRRAGGGILYGGFAEFEAAVDLLCDEDDVRDSLAASGRRYAETEFSWATVLDRYEGLLDTARSAWRQHAETR